VPTVERWYKKAKQRPVQAIILEKEKAVQHVDSDSDDDICPPKRMTGKMIRLVSVIRIPVFVINTLICKLTWNISNQEQTQDDSVQVDSVEEAQDQEKPGVVTKKEDPVQMKEKNKVSND